MSKLKVRQWNVGYIFDDVFFEKIDLKYYNRVQNLLWHGAAQVHRYEITLGMLKHSNA